MIKKKVLITGSNGFIGKNLYFYFKDRKDRYELDLWDGKNVDLLNTGLVRELLIKNKYDLIVHCAIYNAAPNFSHKNKKLVYDNNMKMFNNLVMNKHYFGRMFYFGSGSEKKPDNAYSQSKWEMNEQVQFHHNVFNLRLYSVYGEHADWRYRILNNMCAKAALKLPLVSPENKAVDLLHVNDLCKIVEIFSNKVLLKYKDYDICSGFVVAYEDLAELVDKICQKKYVISDSDKSPKISYYVSYKLPRIYYFGDNSKLLEEIGHYNFSFTPIEVGIKELIEFYETQYIDASRFEY
jgi:GDP-L-fucose synthase